MIPTRSRTKCSLTKLSKALTGAEELTPVLFLDASAILGMLLYTVNQISLFASIEALKHHFAPRKILVAVVVALLGRFVGVKKFSVLGDYEFNSIVFFFFGFDFVGAIVRNLEIISFWICLT